MTSPVRLWLKTKRGWMSVDRALGRIEPGTAQRAREEARTAEQEKQQ